MHCLEATTELRPYGISQTTFPEGKVSRTKDETNEPFPFETHEDKADNKKAGQLSFRLLKAECRPEWLV